MCVHAHAHVCACVHACARVKINMDLYETSCPDVVGTKPICSQIEPLLNPREGSPLQPACKKGMKPHNNLEVTKTSMPIWVARDVQHTKR